MFTFHSRSRRASASLTGVLALLFALLVPLGGPALANHGDRTLDINPESSERVVESTHTVRGTLETADGSAPSPMPGVNIDFEITGANNPDGDESLTTPDLTCTTAADDPTTSSDESATCSAGYMGAEVGMDQIRGWIDHDGDNTTPEADQNEAPNSFTTPGDTPEPDGTDVATQRWFGNLPAGAKLDCNPETATSTTAATRAYDCNVSNSTGGISGIKIDAENLGGAGDPDNSAATGEADYNDGCTTADGGSCSFSIGPSGGDAGPANICFWADEDVDNSYDNGGRENDGGKCSEPVGAAERDNETDVVLLTRKFARTISLKTGKTTVARGESFTLKGKVGSSSAACESGQRVTLRRDVAGGAASFVVFKTTTTGALGGYKVTAKPLKTASYRASVGKSPTCSAATSGTKKVTVRN